jgi:uncharacterized membrane protein HdeD (DUF308 family)
MQNLADLWDRAKWMLLVRGLFGIAIGVFMLARPLASLAVLALLIAAWALVEGIAAIAQAFVLRDTVDHWWVLLLGGMASIVFAIAAMANYPGLSLAFAAMWAALWLLTAGAAGVVVAMRERKAHLTWGWTFVSALIALAAGMAALARPDITLAGLVFVLASFGILGGVARTVAAGRMRRFKVDMKHAMRGPVMH